MKKAIITLTKGAAIKGNELKEVYNDADLYVMPRWKTNENQIEFSSFNELIVEVFDEYDALIFIMATGIVIRKIAKLLKSKDKDPAIIVMDEKGRFVIPILSGHIGGANELALDIEEKFKSIAVLTTSSDVIGKMAVDSFAIKYGLEIESLTDAKDVTALVVNNDKVGLINDTNMDVEYKASNVVKTDKISDEFDGYIYIGNRDFKSDKFTVRLYKKNLVIGAGSRKDIPKEKMYNEFLILADKLKINKNAVKIVASIDIKKDEVTIINLANELRVPFITYTADELSEVENLFEGSDFVKKTIGVASVAEPSAYLASNKGNVILKKTKCGGITLCIYEEEF